MSKETPSTLVNLSQRDKAIFFEAIFNSFDGEIFVCDKESTILYANKSFEKRFGKDYVGKKCYNYLYQKEEVCQFCQSGNRELAPITIIQNPIDNRWDKVSFSSVPLNDETLKMVMMIDISPTKEHQEDLIKKNTMLAELNEELDASKSNIETALKKAKRSEEKYAALFNNMTEGVVINKLILDPHGNPKDYIAIDVNPSYEKIVGITREKAVSTPASILYANEKNKNTVAYLDEFASIVLKNKMLTFTTYFEPHDKYYHIAGIPQKKNTFALIFSDVTDDIKLRETLTIQNRQLQKQNDLLRDKEEQLTVNNEELLTQNEELIEKEAEILNANKELENALTQVKENESKFKSLFYSMNEGAIINKVIYNELGETEDYIAVDVNPAFEKILDISKAKALSMPASLLLYNGMKPPYTSIFTKIAKEGGSFTREIFNDRWQKYFRISVFSHIPDHFVLIFSDITQQKQAEEDLILTKQLVELAATPTLRIDRQGNILFTNKATEELIGYSIEELKTKKIFNLSATIKEENWAIFWETLRNKGNVTTEVFIKSKDDKPITALFSSNYFNYMGIEYNYAYIFDISSRKQLEKELENQKKNLEIMVDVKTKELKNSLESLKEANDHKNKFISSMSHELRTPLNAILGFTQLLEMKYYGPLTEKQDEYIQLIQKSGNHLLSLINDILDLSKINAGSLDLHLTDLSVSDQLEQVLSLINNEFELKKIHLKSDLNDDICTVYADEVKLRQIFLNLLSNALKFTNIGGTVTISVQKENEQFIKFSIKDDGIGIKENDLSKIFGEFYQVKNSDNEAIPGTGIGLTLTKLLIEKQGGQIGVKSSYGEGSEFWFTLPCKA